MSRHHELFRIYARELRDLTWSIHEHRSGHESDEELLDLYLSINEAMMDMLTQQRRAIDHMRGKPVAPMVHFARAVVAGQGGAGQR